MKYYELLLSSFWVRFGSGCIFDHSCIHDVCENLKFESNNQILLVLKHKHNTFYNTIEASKRSLVQSSELLLADNNHML